MNTDDANTQQQCIPEQSLEGGAGLSLTLANASCAVGIDQNDSWIQGKGKDQKPSGLGGKRSIAQGKAAPRTTRAPRLHRTPPAKTARIRRQVCSRVSSSREGDCSMARRVHQVTACKRGVMARETG